MAELTEVEQEDLDHERSILLVYDRLPLPARALRAAARIAALEAKQTGVLVGENA